MNRMYKIIICFTTIVMFGVQGISQYASKFSYELNFHGNIPNTEMTKELPINSAGLNFGINYHTSSNIKVGASWIIWHIQ